jgi:hypothetical protein
MVATMETTTHTMANAPLGLPVAPATTPSATATARTIVATILSVRRPPLPTIAVARSLARLRGVVTEQCRHHRHARHGADRHGASRRP